jgi:DNA-binding beta-propeller fold protein YncE
MSRPESIPTAPECPECDTGPFVRNHYFTGKLMQAVDFDAEQRYGVDKLRHHHRRLHGWGAVCGLKVKEHPQPGCRSRFVCVTPGTAIDCCGRELVVREVECVELANLPAVKALSDAHDTGAHTLQICIRYRECPTEEVPVFYDDIACGGERCAPNRILESFAIDARVDPKPSPVDLPGGPKLEWESTVSPGGARRAAVTAGAVTTGYLYAVAAGQNTVFQLETGHHTVVGTGALPAPGIALAVSADGSRLYVVSERVSAGGKLAKNYSLCVFDTTGNLAKPPFRTFDVPGSGTGDVFLAVAPDKRLLVLLGATGDLILYPSSLDDATKPDPKPDSTVNLGANVSGLAISSDGTQAYTADAANNQVAVLAMAAGGGSKPGKPLQVFPAGFAPSGLALAASTGPDLLAVVGNASAQIALVAPGSAQLVGTVGLAQKPIGVAVAPGAGWAYVLEADPAGQATVQTVDLARIQLKQPVTPGDPLAVGANSGGIVLSPTGRTLYVPFQDAGPPQRPGGIAVIEVENGGCDAILWRSLDHCPDCGPDHCVVLATIDHYHVGDSVQDPTDPPSDPAADEAAHVARIDNRKGRRLLTSTQTLYEWITCLQAHQPKGGGPGAQGPPGAPGAGVEQDLTQFARTSWRHNDGNSVNTALAPVKRLDGSTSRGIWIEFTGDILVADPAHPIDSQHVFQVLVQKSSDAFFRNCRCPVSGTVIPVARDPKTNALAEVDTTAQPTARILAFVWTNDQVNRFVVPSRELWVCFRGDFVVDVKKRAVDVQFVRAEFPTGQRPSGSAFGIEGGIFESWFWLGDRPSNTNT